MHLGQILLYKMCYINEFMLNLNKKNLSNSNMGRLTWVLTAGAPSGGPSQGQDGVAGTDTHCIQEPLMLQRGGFASGAWENISVDPHGAMEFLADLL